MVLPGAALAGVWVRRSCVGVASAAGGVSTGRVFDCVGMDCRAIAACREFASSASSLAITVRRSAREAPDCPPGCSVGGPVGGRLCSSASSRCVNCPRSAGGRCSRRVTRASRAWIASASVSCLADPGKTDRKVVWTKPGFCQTQAPATPNNKINTPTTRGHRRGPRSRSGPVWTSSGLDASAPVAYGGGSSAFDRSVRERAARDSGGSLASEASPVEAGTARFSCVGSSVIAVTPASRPELVYRPRGSVPRALPLMPWRPEAR